jgi:hydroxyacylglutathione hydrolase
MLFQRIESEGLSHYSYLLGGAAEAAVIDPRRDVGVYLELAEKKGYHIRYVLETHRNEDYLIGSCELAGLTGAEIWHADGQLAYRYGMAVEDGQEWQLGSSILRAIHTPGHTPGSMSYLLSDTRGVPLMVFTGDTLFAGEVGRTDLLGTEKIPELSGLLHDSIFGKMVPLGDGVLVCPAHGSGSVCGSAISDRPWTTIGTERLTNPRLQLSGRDEFVRAVGVEHEKPPYFTKMEDLNLSGPPSLKSAPTPKALSPDLFAGLARDSIILDTRFDGFGTAHVPGSLCISLSSLSSYGGWFLPYDRDILLVGDLCHLDTVTEQLRRMGYDRIEGYLAGGILAWHKAGRDTESIPTVTVPELCHRLDTGGDTWILDVRSRGELETEGEIPGAYNLPIKQIDGRRGEVPQDRPVFIFCGSGLRSMVVASMLQKDGWQNLTVVLGGFSAWKSVSCPLQTKQFA